MVTEEKEVGEEEGDPSCYGDAIGESVVVTASGKGQTFKLELNYLGGATLFPPHVLPPLSKPSLARLL